MQSKNKNIFGKIMSGWVGFVEIINANKMYIRKYKFWIQEHTNVNTS